jgi:hypothetical protein
METNSHHSLPGLRELLKQSWHLWRSRSNASNSLLFLTLGFGLLPLLLSFSDVLVVISSIVGAVIYILTSGAYNILFLSHEDLSASDALRKTYSLFWSYIWVGILAMVIIAAGIILLIIPGIWIGLLFGVAHLSLFDRGYKGKDALAHSWYLVEGRWWKIFLYSALIIITVAIIAGIISGIVAAPFSKEAEDPISNLVSILFMPYLSAFSVVLYKSLKSTKEDISSETIQRYNKKISKLLYGSLVVLIAFVVVVILLFRTLPPTAN